MKTSKNKNINVLYGIVANTKEVYAKIEDAKPFTFKQKLIHSAKKWTRLITNAVISVMVGSFVAFSVFYVLNWWLK